MKIYSTVAPFSESPDITALSISLGARVPNRSLASRISPARQAALQRWKRHVALILLCLLSTPAHSRDLQQDLHDFMRFAVEDPKSFGFENETEAREARMGRAYALYILEDWSSDDGKSDTEIKADPDRALDKVHVVLNRAGQPRCVLIYGRKSHDEEFRPLLLGQPYLARLLAQLEGKPDLQDVVLIVKPSTRTFHYANTKNPEVIHDFD